MKAHLITPWVLVLQIKSIVSFPPNLMETEENPFSFESIFTANLYQDVAEKVLEYPLWFPDPNVGAREQNHHPPNLPDLDFDRPSSYESTLSRKRQSIQFMLDPEQNEIQPLFQKKNKTWGESRIVVENPFNPDDLLNIEEGEDSAIGVARIEKVEKQQEGSKIDSNVLFNVYNWNYMTAKEASNEIRHPTRFEQFLSLLNGCKEEDDREEFFWIPRDKIYTFMPRYRKLDLRLIAWHESHSQRRKKDLGKIVLNLSKQLNLEEYPCFTDEILGRPLQKYKSWVKSAEERGDPKSKRAATFSKYKRTLEYVEKVTKISAFLMIIHMSLFKDHRDELLRKEDVNSILGFLRDFWEEAESNQSEILKKRTWTERIPVYLALDENLFNGQNYKNWYKRDELWYETAEDIMECWKEKRTTKSNEQFDTANPYPTEIGGMVEAMLTFSHFQRMEKYLPERLMINLRTEKSTSLLEGITPQKSQC